MIFSFRSFFVSGILLVVFGIFFTNNVGAQALNPHSSQGKFCQFSCQIGGSTPRVVDYDAGVCEGGSGVFRPDPRMCQTRCDETCARRGGTCSRFEAPTCATVPVEWLCSCPCRARGVTTGDPTNVVSDQHYCTVTDGRASGESCRASCTAICGQSNKEYVTTQAPTCRAAGPSAQNDPVNQHTTPTESNTSIPTAPALNLNFPDPLGGDLTVNTLIGNIVRIIVGLVGVLFVGVFMWSGFLYLTAGGDSKQTKSAKDGITNAVLGLAVVMMSYVLVSFLIETTNRLQGHAGPTEQTPSNQSTTPGRSTAPVGTSSFGDTRTPATPGSPQDACRRMYGSDPSTCFSNGSCPSGVTSLEGLFALWGPTLASTPAGAGRTAADLCRACINQQIENSQGRFPGLDNTCVPALTNFWRVACSGECTAGRVPSPGTTTGGGPTTGPSVGSNLCDPDTYNTRSRDAGSDLCNRCITYWSSSDHVEVIAGVACAQPREKAAVWCATNETRSRHQSPGYCNVVR